MVGKEDEKQIRSRGEPPCENFISKIYLTKKRHYFCFAIFTIFAKIN